jgi:peptide deformylase
MAKIVTDISQLREVSKPARSARHARPTISLLIKTLEELAGGACGLSAIQLGIPLRIFAIKTRSYPIVFVNPEITWESEEKILFQEECLSLPGRRVQTLRPLRIRIKTLNHNRELEFSEFESVVVSHEYDHLDGVLITDREFNDMESLQII